MKRLHPIILCLALLLVACSEHDEEHAQIEQRGLAGPSRLGFPLETPVKITGRQIKGRHGIPALSVQSVNDKKLNEPIPVELHNLESRGLSLYALWVLKGFESGRVTGCKPGGPLAHLFYRYFVVTEVIEPRSVRIKQEAPNESPQGTP